MSEGRTQTLRLGCLPDDIERAATLLREGGLVAFPTETVYGLGARADDAGAVRRIFAAKGRPAENPLIVHVPDAAGAASLCADWSRTAAELAGAFWPGPLTLVVPVRPGALPPEVTAGGNTVALRVPKHPVALALLSAAGVPIAAPSANPSQSISPTTAEHVLKGLEGRIDAVVFGGRTERGLESTIVDVSSGQARILRRGAVALEAIAAIVPVEDIGGEVVPEGSAPRAPGGYARHYAPRAAFFVVPAADALRIARERSAAGARVGQLARRGDAPGADDGPLVELLPDDAEGYGAELYAALHRLDDAGPDVILAAEVPADDAWAAVRDRLRRAAG